MIAPEALLQSLENRGWAVSTDIIADELAKRLYGECRSLWDAGRFRPAKIGRGGRQTYEAAIRGDSICWLEPDRAGPAGREFLNWMAGFRNALNQAFYLGLRSDEFHFARYPAGAGYRKHLDRHQGTTARKVSVTVYLNQDWPAGSGGELHLYAAGDDATPAAVVPPVSGHMAVFLSDIIPHEVRPAARTRWSLTGWLRTDPPP